jgi:hypothetical protein
LFDGKKRLVLETNGKLEAAVSLYRKLGFAERPRSARPTSEHARVDLVMELPL